MSPRIVIHAGMHKTGSTSIQQVLMRRRPAGISVPRAAQANQSDLARLLFERGPRLEQFRQSRRPGLSMADIQRERARRAARLSRDIARSQAPVFVFSAEDLSDPELPPEAVARMAAFFGELSDRVEVVAYVRPPLSFMSSAYLQRLRELKPAALTFAPQTLWPEYRRRFEKFDMAFGRSAVHLRAFDRATLDGGDAVRDFFGFAGVVLPEADILRSNDSISLEGMSLLYLRLCLDAGRSLDIPEDRAAQLRQLTARRVRDLPGARVRLSQDLLDEVRKDRAGDLDWIENRMGRSLDEPATPGGLTAPEDLIRAGYRNLGLLDGLPSAPGRPSRPARLARAAMRRLKQTLRLART